MKQKGFTLTEMIAVVLIIALLTIIILPSILNQLQSQKDNISKASMQLIYDATELYIKERQSMYPMAAGETYCISLESLVNAGKLKNPLQDLSTGKNISLNKIVKVLVNEYEEGEYSLLDPQEEVCESAVELPEILVNITGKKASITLKSEVGITGYAITKKGEEVKEWTQVDGLKETMETYEATEAGEYTAWVKDKYGKTNYQDFTIEIKAFNYTAIYEEVAASATQGTKYCPASGIYTYWKEYSGWYYYCCSSCAQNEANTGGANCKAVSSTTNMYVGQSCSCSNPCGTETIYSCNEGYTLNDSNHMCYRYSCPNGGTLNGTMCEFK